MFDVSELVIVLIIEIATENTTLKISQCLTTARVFQV